MVSLDKSLSILLIFSKTPVLVLFLFSIFIFSWLKFMTAKDTIYDQQRKERRHRQSPWRGGACFQVLLPQVLHGYAISTATDGRDRWSPKHLCTLEIL